MRASFMNGTMDGQYFLEMVEASKDMIMGKQGEQLVKKWWKEGVLTGFALYVLYRYYQDKSEREKLRKAIEKNKSSVAKKKQQMIEKLSRHGVLVTEKRKEIINLPITELADNLRDGSLDPVEVLEAYQAKALEATEITNAICYFLEEATEEAKKLRSIPKEERGPLHGIPISVKACFFIKGHEPSIGIAKMIGNKSPKDATFIQMLKEKGAIPFCTTNFPQTLYSYGSSNPMYGQALNPWDLTRSPGGSSSGEGALIAQGGSILGIGTDVGGSVRIPAQFCGITSLKPCDNRLFDGGRLSGGAVGVHSNPGFLSPTVGGVILAMKAILSDVDHIRSVDANVAPIKWQKDLFTQKKITVGYFYDNIFPITPGCQRAVTEAVEALKRVGYEVIHYQPSMLGDIMDTYLDNMLSDGGASARKLLKYEEIDQSIKVSYYMNMFPMWIKRSIFKWILSFFSPSTGRAATKGKDQVSELWKSCKRAKELREQLFDEMKRKNIDVLIGPGFPTPALKLDEPSKLGSLICATAIANALNLPAGLVPITLHNEDDEKEMATKFPPGGKDLLFSLVRNSMKSAVGLPMGVNVFGKPWQEELVLNVMNSIEKEVQFRRKYSEEISKVRNGMAK